MDVKKYLEMDTDALNEYLIADVMAHFSQVLPILKEVKRTKRYQEDEVFRAFIDSGEELAEVVSGDRSGIYELSGELVGRTRRLRLWNLVSLHWNLLGNFYQAWELYEKAMECYYHVIRNEKEHGLRGFLSIAYNNISMTYDKVIHIESVDSYGYDMVCARLELAISSLKEGGEDQPRYFSKLMICMSNLAWYLVRMKKLNESKKMLEEIEGFDFSKLSIDAFYFYYRALTYYLLMTGDLEGGHRAYLKVRRFIPENDEALQMGIVVDYVNLARMSGVDPLFYRKEISELESFESQNPKLMNMEILHTLWTYYKMTANSKKLSEVKERYISAMEEHFKTARSGRLQGLNMVDEVLNKKDKAVDESFRNSELTTVAEEAVRSKNESQYAYHRLNLVHHLGQKLTSSMDSGSVADLIFENLKENFPMTAFLLMISDEERRKLRSVAYYEEGMTLPEICFDWEDPNSLFAQCFRTKRTIVIDDFAEDPRFHYRKTLWARKSVRSGVFVPLIVEEKVIGAFSVQDRSVATYGEEALKFLGLLTPYLAIALNNAMYSRKLEREIHERKLAQKELEAANRKLKHLSSLDGLTQVSNRREFERRLLEMLRFASEDGKTLSIFMFDIDDFKQYNDTYGHLQGDETLKAVAVTLRENLERAGGISARFGGEEFIGACVGLSVAENRQLSERVCEEIRGLKIPHVGVPLGIVTLSIGVAVGKGKALSNKSLLMRSADISLYRAKNEGKNRAILNIVSDIHE